MKKIITIVLITIIPLGSSLSAKNVYAISLGVNFPNNENIYPKPVLLVAKIEYRHIFPKNFQLVLRLNGQPYEEYSPRRTLKNPYGSSAITSGLYCASLSNFPITATRIIISKVSKFVAPIRRVLQ
jgi:hypothetical protein